MWLHGGQKQSNGALILDQVFWWNRAKSVLQDGQYERDGPAGSGVKTSGCVRGTRQEESSCTQGANRCLGGHRDEAAGLHRALLYNGWMAVADGGRKA